MGFGTARVVRLVVLLALGGALTTGTALGGPNGPKKQPKGTDGDYVVTVSGYYTGRGTANVKNNKVELTAVVTDESGNSVLLEAKNLKLDGPHFSGVGRVDKAKVLQIRGRLDGYNPDQTFLAARIICDYTDDAGKRGRIAGVLTPAAAPSPSKPGGDDDDD